MFVCTVNVMAAVSITVCWLVVVVVWLVTANYNETRAPAERRRSWYGTGVVPVAIIFVLVRGLVPHADWQPVTPIYTGLLGMMLGTLLVAGAGPWIVPVPIALILIEFKIRIEERFMTAEFPQEYPRYRKRVPQLVPGLRLVTGHRAVPD
jgi:hypothetical protein